MKLLNWIFLALLLACGTGLTYFWNWIQDDLRPRYLEAVEENLIDQSMWMASVVQLQIEQGFSPDSLLKHSLKKANDRSPQAQIYRIEKLHEGLHFYITDSTGKILYHSQDSLEIGKDYSQWQDVALTLKGSYGARSTKPRPEGVSSLYVGAPIYTKEGRIWGCLTLIKDTQIYWNFISIASTRWAAIIFLTGVGILSLAYIISWGAMRPLKRLMVYAKKAQEGISLPPPRSKIEEWDKLSLTLDQMRQSLEGKEYVEQYIQLMSHELKSPITSIQASVEILQESPDKDIQQRFLNHIQNDTERLKSFAEKLSLLSHLEYQSALQFSEFSLNEALQEWIPLWEKQLSQNRQFLKITGDSSQEIYGKKDFIQMALQNLIENAADFSPQGSTVELHIHKTSSEIHIEVMDEGVGIPEYAQNKIFERFFSTPRSLNGRKSSGLGLAMVKEIMRLHKGSIQYRANQPKGSIFTLQF